MGFFDFGKKQKQQEVPEEPLRNYPQMLTAKLLFAEKPVIDKERLTTKLATTHPGVHSPDGESTLLYFFPDIKVSFEEGAMPAQCTILQPNADDEKAEIAPEAFQQNWHWAEARVASPQVVYSFAAQKLIEADDLIDSWTNPDQRALHGLVNVRLFNISNGLTGEILMDTVGLHLLGLPDFQIRFADLDEGAVGQALWNYAYYVYEHGDMIADGNTIQGLTAQAKWKCERQIALVAPERVVIHLHTS